MRAAAAACGPRLHRCGPPPTCVRRPPCRSLNSSLNLLNKWSLGVYGFRFPFLLTSCERVQLLTRHAAVQSSRLRLPPPSECCSLPACLIGNRPSPPPLLCSAQATWRSALWCWPPWRCASRGRATGARWRSSGRGWCTSDRSWCAAAAAAAAASAAAAVAAAAVAAATAASTSCCCCFDLLLLLLLLRPAAAASAACCLSRLLLRCRCCCFDLLLPLPLLLTAAAARFRKC